jgi:hypothetical protein
VKLVKASALNYSANGGLPGICFICDVNAKKIKLDSQLETILERELRLIYETTLSYATLHRHGGSNPSGFWALKRKKIAFQALYSSLIATCCALWNYKVGPFRLSTFRTRGGAEIPSVIQTNKGSLGILPLFAVKEFRVSFAKGSFGKSAAK